MGVGEGEGREDREKSKMMQLGIKELVSDHPMELLLEILLDVPYIDGQTLSLKEPVTRRGLGWH